MSQVVTLNELEQLLAFHVAMRRLKSNREHMVKNARISNNSDIATDLEGAAAEIAVAKALGAYPDLEIYPQSHTYDLLTPGGKRVDVKQTNHSNGKLLARLSKHQDDCDIYILAIGSLPRYEIKGWAWSRELIDEKNIVDLGYGPTYAMDADRLRPIPSRL